MNENQKTELIAYFSANNFFRKKSIEKQSELFNELKADFNNNHDFELQEFHLDVLLHYHAEQREKKIAREKRKLEKNNLPVSAGQNLAYDHIQILPPGRYVLTCAQNNTEIDINFFESLLLYCELNNAQLIIAKTTYNKSGFQQPALDTKELLWYAPELRPYLIDSHISLDNKAHFIGDANIIVTAKNPLSGFESATDSGIDCIVPASKISLTVSAALKNDKTKILASTGMVTKRNYITRKAGCVASLEHATGAIFYDTETGELRHLQQMDKFTGFYDFHTLYTPKGSELDNHAIEVFNVGDIHAEKLPEKQLDKLNELIGNLKPKHIMLHDLLDFSSRNHHNIKDCVFIHKQYKNNQTVENDLKRMAYVVDSMYASYSEGKYHIIESNHDLAFEKWLKTSDFKLDPINAITYLNCFRAVYENHDNEDFNLLEWAYYTIGLGKNEPIFHKTDESVKMAGVEMGYHGHNGINGAKGSPQSFRKLGIPMNTGHTHSPSIQGFVYTAGCNNLDMGYNLGASSWRLAHIITYKNGQRQIYFQ